MDGVVQAPGGATEDTDGGFTHGGWTVPFWHDGIGQYFGTLMSNVDAVLLGKRTYVSHAEAFEPDPSGDPFAGATKYVVSTTLEKPMWRNTTIIANDHLEAIRTIKSSEGKDILTDGSSQLVPELLKHDLVDELNLFVYPLVLGGGKRIFVDGFYSRFTLKKATPFPTGVVAMHYVRN